jgi:hypothetical protein
MVKKFDPQIVNPIITGFVEDLIVTKGGLIASKPYEILPKPINEYEGRMRVNASEKFDVAVYIASVSFYLNQADMQGQRARGALVMYIDAEVSDKIFKAAGLQVPYDEDDESMMTMGGTLCQMVADAVKDSLAAAGFASILVSEPCVYKNSIPEGVAFSKEQKEKQEISFYFLKHKAVAIDWTLAAIPKK